MQLKEELAIAIQDTRDKIHFIDLALAENDVLAQPEDMTDKKIESAQHQARLANLVLMFDQKSK